MYFIILFAFFQGFTEFLPISSQGHLILINSFSNSEEKILLSILDANVLVHFGSICSVILYYRRELFDFLISVKHLPRPDIDSDSRMLINLIFATTPTLLIGFLFSKYFDYNSDQILLLIGITSLVFGCILPSSPHACTLHSFPFHDRIVSICNQGFGALLSSAQL